MTIQTAVLIDTLKALGADVALGLLQHLLDPGTSGPRRLRRRHPGVCRSRASPSVDYWDYTHRIFEWATAAPPNLILDDGGDATLLIHLGLRAEKGDTKFLDGAGNEEEEVLFASIKKRLKDKPGWYGEKRQRASAASRRRRPPAWHRLYEMQKKGTLLWPAIKSTTASQVQVRQPLRCRESLVDGIRRGTDVMMAGKVAMVCGYRRRRQGSAASLRQAGCRVMVSGSTRSAPCRPAMESYEVATMDDAARTRHLRDSTGNLDVITVEHMRRMKHRAIVRQHRATSTARSGRGLKNFKWHNVKPQVRRDRVPTASGSSSCRRGGLVNSATPWPPELRDVVLLPNQTLASSSFSPTPASTRRRSTRLPKHLDEKVARLHLDKIGAKLQSSRKQSKLHRRGRSAGRTSRRRIGIGAGSNSHLLKASD